jgi:hypothetical protein
MSDYDKEQESVFVKQHKRIAIGVPLDGQTLETTGRKSQSDNQSQTNRKEEKTDK